MYPKSGAISTAAGAPVLASTGLSVGWTLMLAMMLFVLGATLIRLAPRRDTALDGHPNPAGSGASSSRSTGRRHR